MNHDMLTCKKCLLYEMPDAKRYQNMYDYIANLDDDVKVPESVYQQRLSICKECDQLLAGMCRICGCYVEMRAVMKQRSCPAVDAKW
ncbi:MAG: DUF6171 family protein [Clostridiales bacterium]|nr:DUF6171 family protein [Clostridiales bacterium]